MGETRRGGGGGGGGYVINRLLGFDYCRTRFLQVVTPKPPRPNTKRANHAQADGIVQGSGMSTHHVIRVDETRALREISISRP